MPIGEIEDDLAMRASLRDRRRKPRATTRRAGSRSPRRSISASAAVAGSFSGIQRPWPPPWRSARCRAAGHRRNTKWGMRWRSRSGNTAIGAPAPEPQRVDRRLARGGIARGIARMVVQGHLRLARQQAPATGLGRARDVLEQVIAQRLVRCGERRQRGFLRQAQVPTRRMRCIQPETVHRRTAVAAPATAHRRRPGSAARLSRRSRAGARH
jgi:hypothetical protein